MLCDAETKKKFNTYASEISRLGKYLSREDMTPQTKEKADAILAIYRQMQSKRKQSLSFRQKDVVLRILPCI